MPQPSPQPGVMPAHQAINKYFELSLYLLVLMGFGALASTGGLGVPAMLLVGAALAFRGYLLTERRQIVISESWTTPLTLAYFCFYALDYFLLSRSFLTATVHLVLFAVVVRSFSLRRDRDYTMLAILAFLMVLASAVLTVDSVFLFFFAGFMLMAVSTFILMEMRRSGRAARFRARHSHDVQHRDLAFSLARVTPVLVLMILVGAAAVFFLLPRMSAGYLGGYSFGTDFSTGFSDRVQLGRIGQIQQSNAVVMHIQIDGDPHGRYALHWRGVALANFDGKNWSNPHEQYPLPRDVYGGFPVPVFSQGVAQAALARTEAAPGRWKRLIHYRVLMEPIGTNVFFLAPWARRVSGAYRAVQIDTGGAVSDLDGERAVSLYEADSDISTPSPEQLRSAGNELPLFVSAYLQTPPALDPRISRLAAQISGPASNSYDKAVALEQHLKTHYGYTLQLPSSPVADPVANFLFERKQGHCEYFASSLAVMLRTLRIPSRVVNGFVSEEFNDLTGNYVVRARNAHAWVEAYFPNYGWVTFDPTPDSATGSPEGWGRVMLYLDAASSFWREWVVSYDSSHQNILGQTVLTGTRGSLDRTRTWARLRYARMLNWARRSQRSAEHAPVRWFVGSAVVALLLLGLANAGRIARMLRARRLQTHPERSPGQAAAMWYERMARSLARRGVHKAPPQTAQEFVRVIADQRLRARVERFTDAYESARFGNSAEEALRLPELYEEIELATKK
jgi:protein-glutamine gamma-glutamyltransferase